MPQIHIGCVFFLENLVISTGGSVGNFGQHFCSLILCETPNNLLRTLADVLRLASVSLSSPSTAFSPGTDVEHGVFERSVNSSYGPTHAQRPASTLLVLRCALAVTTPPPTVPHWDSILCPVFLSLPPHSLPLQHSSTIRGVCENSFAGRAHRHTQSGIQLSANTIALIAHKKNANR